MIPKVELPKLDGPLDNQSSIHMEDRLADYIEALVKSGRCLSKNSYIRGLVAAAYAWGDDDEWCDMVAHGIRQYERKFGARV